jgi:hypothetical protein
MYSAGAGENPGENACGIRLHVPLVRSGGEFQMFSPEFPPAPLIPHGLWVPGRLKTAGFRIHSMVSGARAANLWVKFSLWGPVSLPTSALFTPQGRAGESAVRAGGKGGGPMAGGRTKGRSFLVFRSLRTQESPGRLLQAGMEAGCFQSEKWQGCRCFRPAGCRLFPMPGFFAEQKPQAQK